MRVKSRSIEQHDMKTREHGGPSGPAPRNIVFEAHTHVLHQAVQYPSGWALFKGVKHELDFLFL